LRIALDATYSVGEALSGVGVYSREVLGGMAAAHPDVRFDFCYRPHRFLRARGAGLPPNVRRRLLIEPLGPRSADLFHGLNQRLPRIPMRRSIATFHDLFVMTGEYSTPEFRARFTAQARDAAARADAIITVSAFTASQVVALLGVPASHVHVVHHGVRALELPRGIRRENVIFSVGALQERKNTARLVEAFESVGAGWKLVLAGSLGYGAAAILARIERSPARTRILVPGYLTPAQLGEWYARALVFAFPSLDEGFGMPVLEAMSAGLPVVTSNRSALPEVAGDAALQVNPLDTQEIAAALTQLTQDETLRQDLSIRGRDRARLYTWDSTIRETWKVYRKVLS
jgi:glycosyltransferase involved in cell wall biosynthesis